MKKESATSVMKSWRDVQRGRTAPRPVDWNLGDDCNSKSRIEFSEIRLQSGMEGEGENRCSTDGKVLKENEKMNQNKPATNLGRRIQ